MKINHFLFGALTLLTVSCQSDSREHAENDNAQVHTEQETPVKMIEYLVGEWQLDDTAQGQENATRGGNKFDRLTFTEEARYIIHSGNQKTDSGAFRMNEQLRNLYLESESDEQPREYEIDLKTDVMTLKLRTPEAGQENAAYTFRRVGSSQ